MDEKNIRAVGHAVRSFGMVGLMTAIIGGGSLVKMLICVSAICAGAALEEGGV